MKTTLPFRPSPAALKACLAALVQKGALKRHDQNSKAFKWNNIAGSGGPRGELTNADLGHAFEAVVDIARGQRLARRSFNGFHFRLSKNEALAVRSQQKGFPLHACITSNATDTLASTDIIVPFVFRGACTQFDEFLENDFLAHRACHHVLAHDARRNLVFGVSAMDDEMRVHYLSRSHSSTSEPIFWKTDPQELVRVVLAFVFATPEELGFDPHVDLVDGNFLYELPAQLPHRPQPLAYLTQELLTPPSPQETPGRVSRIWKVVEVESRANPVFSLDSPRRVLKDAWISRGRSTEGEIQSRIFQAIRDFASSPNWQSDARLDTLSAEEKKELEALLHDDKFREMFLCVQQEYRGTPIEYIRSVFALLPDPPPGERNSPKYAVVPATDEMTRCFMVFNDFCTPVHQLPTLGEAVSVITQSLMALRLLTLAGWIHHDISAGNVMAFRQGPRSPWTVKLSDFEHAREYSPTQEEGTERMGTPFFMAYQIKRGMRLYRRRRTPIYEPCHDVESLWWILLWLILMRIGGNEYSPYLASSIFEDASIPSQLRTETFFEGLPDDLINSLHSWLRPVTPTLEVLRLAFHRHYSEYSSDPPLESFLRVNQDVRAELLKLTSGGGRWTSASLVNPRPLGFGRVGLLNPEWKKRGIEYLDRHYDRAPELGRIPIRRQQPARAAKKRQVEVLTPDAQPADTKQRSRKRSREDDHHGSRVEASEKSRGKSRAQGRETLMGAAGGRTTRSTVNTSIVEPPRKTKRRRH